MKTLSTLNYETLNWPASPVVIDTARCLAFIELDAGFLLAHRAQQSLRLFGTHLCLLHRFGFRALLGVCWLRRLLFARAFHIAARFLLRSPGRRR